MERTAEETASILISIYDESFANESYNHFRIGWPELRSIAGVARLTDEYLWEINQTLNESSYFLIPFDNFLLVALESDVSHVRAVPPRIVEDYLPGDEDDDDFELDEDDDDDNLGYIAEFGIFDDASSKDEVAEPRDAEPVKAAKSKGGRKAKKTTLAEEMAE